MKKNKIFWIIAAVVIAALAMTGCPPDDPGTEPELTDITVTPESQTLGIGQNFNLTANPVPSTAKLGDIDWESEDAEKVSVDASGKITALEATTTPVKVYAKSKANPEISGFSSITVTAAPIPTDDLKLTFIPGPSFVDTPPTLPEKDEDNVYVIEDYFPDGNFQGGAAGSGFIDTVLLYPDRVLNGDFKFRVRVQITDAKGLTSASKGLIIGAFRGKEETEDFQTGSGGTVATAINVRLNNALRNLQSRENDRLAAVGLNTTLHDKMEEFIYEVIRTEDGIVTNMYISKNGELLTQYSSTSAISYNPSSVQADIQADTPVYAGIALCAITARISQVELWDGDLEGDPVFYTGDSTPAPVAVTGISVTVQGNKGTLIAGSTSGISTNPAQYYVKQGAAEGSLQLEVVLQPAYADVQGAKFYASTIPEHPNDATITVDESGTVTISGTGSKTIQAISNDEIGASYYMTINVTPDYVPVDDFTIVSESTEMLEGNAINLSTDINFALITDPTIVWTTSDSAKVTFVTTGEQGEETAETVTGPTARIKGLAAGTATITATATTTDGTTPTVKTATKQFTVLGTSGQELHWKFDTLPTGWTEATNAAAPYNVNTDYGNGLTLHAGYRTQMIRATQTASGADETFTAGCLQPGGNGVFATLGPVTGPFTLTLNYTGAGSNDRYPILSFSSDGVVASSSNGSVTNPISGDWGIPAATASTGTSDPKTYSYSYTGTDAVYVHFASGGNAIRLFDIIVQFSAPTQTVIWQWNAGDGWTNNTQVNGISVTNTGGSVSLVSENMKMGNSRWVLGYATPTYSSGTATANNAYVTNGELAFTGKFKITVVYTSATGTGNFYVYLNNNTTSGGNAVLLKGTTAVIFQQNNLTATGGTLTFTLDPDTELALTSAAETAGITKAAVLSSSFLQFRAESSLTEIIISSIVIENVD